MIKLSDMLAATLDDKDPLIALKINEAKRLEALDVPHNPVATYTPTPERKHEWVIYRDKGEGHFRWYYGHVHLVNSSNGWTASPTLPDVQRFATAAEAQDYINSNGIQDAYPWPVPKLSEK